MIMFANFSEAEQTISNKILVQQNLLGKKCIHGQRKITSKGDLIIGPLEFIVLK